MPPTVAFGRSRIAICALALRLPTVAVTFATPVAVSDAAKSPAMLMVPSVGGDTDQLTARLIGLSNWSSTIPVICTRVPVKTTVFGAVTVSIVGSGVVLTV